MAHDTYLSTRYFPALDGLRAISVLMVVAFHTHDPLWEPLHGYLGVTVFFVISGMLITTLLLREERRDGSVGVRAFYRRRWWRIVPLYLVALACFSAGVMIGVAGGGANYGERLVNFLTFTNELAGPGTFAHSWSLGIEEKFYFAWPLLGFVFVPLARRRALVIAVLLAVTIGSLAFGPRAYPVLFAPILIGCGLALALHDRTWFARLAPLRSGPALACLLVLAAVTATLLDPVGYVPLTNVPFAFAVALLFPAVLLAGNALHRVLATRVLNYVGRRSYGIYLFHLFCVDAVARVLPEGGAVPQQIARFALIAGGSVLVAEVLYRTVEGPLIAASRRRAASPHTPPRARRRAVRA